MKKATVLLSVLLFTLLALPTLASASTPVGGPNNDGASATDITATAKVLVRRVESGPDRIHLFDPETEEVHVLVFSEKTRLTARHKKDFDGRRKLEFADLAEGQTLKITYRLDDGQITGIQVVEKAS